MFLSRAGDADATALEAEFGRLESEARERLDHEGVPGDQMSLERRIAMRYLGQWRSLSIPVDSPLTSLQDALARFHAEHEREYSYRRDGAAIEIYQLQVTAIGLTPKPEFARHPLDRAGKPQPVATRPVYFDETNDGALDTPVYARGKLPAGARIEGPAVIEQLDSTTLIPPGVTAEVDEWLNIRMQIGDAG
jgi:N-methylhydantoinase A